MSDTTPNLALPLIAAAQAQKHVTHNEALTLLDALVNCAVLDKDLSGPPTSPGEGARYIVGPSPTGDWAGKAGMLAVRSDGAWTYVAPQAGFLAHVRDEATLYVHDGAAWRPSVGLGDALQSLRLLGIGTTADVSNPFSAKLGSALWTAKGVGEGGTGDLRYVLNKEASANVLSLLFQTGYSGRLEIGLVGSDDLSLKVSPDGATWRTALLVDRTSGGVDFLSAEGSVAAAATTDLGAVKGRRVAVGGSGAITSFGTGQNLERLLRFSTGITLTHDPTALILPGGANIATAAGDRAYATSDASGHWTIRHYQRADGKAVVAPSAGELGQGAWISYTPVVTAGTGTLTSASASGAYQVFGKLLLFQLVVTITTNGTAAGTVLASLPAGMSVTTRSGAAFVAVGREQAATGRMLQGVVAAGGTMLAITNADNSYPGANGYQLSLTGFCEVM